VSQETAARLALQRRIDQEALYYIREMQAHGPMTLDVVYAYVRNTRRINVTLNEMQDRISYLVDKGSLKTERVWDAGEYATQYTITAKGRDILDGALPPDA
jgi:hypothetical protein